MDEITKELRKAMDCLKEEIAITGSSRQIKDYAHLAYTYGLYNLEQQKDMLRTYAHCIQKWYDPKDKKMILAVRIVKKRASSTFRTMIKMQSILERFSDDMDNKIFTLED